MSLTLSSNCPVCGTKEHLSRCAACKVTFYCGREHQASDRPDHQRGCKAVKKAREALESQEAELRAMPGDFMTPAGETIFEEAAGHFWGIIETRPYMQARFAFAEALLKIKTSTAVEAALSNLLDMLRLCRGDNMGVRYLVPALFLRLGRDQECYDFVKWWAITGKREDYDWGDMEEPYLDLKDENPFESIEFFARKHFCLSFSIAATLLKIRLLFDLRALKNSTIVGDKVPQEVLDNIRSQMVGNIVAQRKDIMEGKNLDSLADDLQGQVEDMYRVVKKSNRYFWPALLQPGANLIAQPQPYSPGSTAEMQLMLQYSYISWVETPRAIDFIGKMIADGNA